MAKCREHGWNPNLLVFSPIGQILRPRLASQWQERHGALERLGLKACRLPSPPSRFPQLWSEGPSLRWWLRCRLGRDPQAVLHCRGHAATLLALDAREASPGLKVVFDCRGIEGEEYAYVRGYTGITEAPEHIACQARLIDTSERRAAHGADRIICVSDAMRREVSKRWRVPPDKISVLPCCTDTSSALEAYRNRDSLRQELGLSGRLVVAYCGSLERWQMPEACLAWFNCIREIRTDAHFLAVTTHPERIINFANAAGIPESRRTVISVPQAEVALYLAAADCGLLIREPSLVNRVASPVKFAEYLAAGVPLLISDNVGDYSGVIRTFKLGAVLPESCSGEPGRKQVRDFLARMESEGRTGIASRCAKYAAEHLEWARMCDRLDWVYRN